jgi:hypothetical protein
VDSPHLPDEESLQEFVGQILQLPVYLLNKHAKLQRGQNL